MTQGANHTPNRDTIMIGPAQPNALDNVVIEKLISTPSFSLPVDRFANLLSDKGTLPTREHVQALRSALIDVYIAAGTIRLNARAKTWQNRSAARALSSLKKALGHLSDVAPPKQRGLHAIFGAPLDDPKGHEESNVFHRSCWQLKLDLVPIVMRLSELIDRERGKSGTHGGRKKRLRVLVEELVAWWELTGRRLAPYVKAKRRDGGPAVVIGRFDDLVSLAQVLFCELDGFSQPEVLAAITNVHEALLVKRKSSRSRAR